MLGLRASVAHFAGSAPLSRINMAPQKNSHAPLGQNPGSATGWQIFDWLLDCAWVCCWCLGVDAVLRHSQDGGASCTVRLNIEMAVEKRFSRLIKSCVGDIGLLERKSYEWTEDDLVESVETGEGSEKADAVGPNQVLSVGLWEIINNNNCLTWWWWRIWLFTKTQMYNWERRCVKWSEEI